VNALDDESHGIGAVLRSPGYAQWRTQVEAIHGCAAPIHLHGSSRVLDRDGAVLIERSGTVLAPCGNRRESVCPSCSDRYAADAFHLLRAGLAGDNTKSVPATVVEHPRAFLTLTAPSFGPVHTRTVTRRGLVVPCGCGDPHSADDQRVGTARDLDAYDYDGAVLWQAHAGTLWSRFTTAVRRALAVLLGVTAREFRDHVRLSFAKVAEYQRRGLVHFHAVVRLDGPDGPEDPPPSALDHRSLATAVRRAVEVATLRVDRPDGSELVLGWGRQLDVRPVTSAAACQLEDADTGEMTDAALAGYVAKYATKGTGVHEGADRPIRDVSHVEQLPIPAHHRRMISTAWELGGRPEYEGLHLRKWAHMLGFRGHFLTKSRRYSTTLSTMRGERRSHRLASKLSQLDRDTDDPHRDGDRLPVDLATITVVNNWWPVHFGHRDDGERELAGAIAERHRQQRMSRMRKAAP